MDIPDSHPGGRSRLLWLAVLAYSDLQIERRLAMKWVRPALSCFCLAAITAAFFMGKIPSEAVVAVWTAAIVWWFRARDEEKKK